MASKQWREEQNAKPSTPKQSRRKQSSNAEPRPLHAWMGSSKKAAVLAILTAGIVFLAFKGYEFIQPKTKVEIYPQWDHTADTTPFSGNQSYPANWYQIQSIENGVHAVEKIDSKLRPMGPNEDVLVYFVSADAKLSNGELLVLKNNGDVFAPENWIRVSELLIEILEYPLKDESRSPVQRILILDICQFDPVSENLGADIKPYLMSEIESLEKRPGVTQVALDNLWVLSSVDRLQSGWHSPEVGSSIFSFFVGQGLRGWSPDRDENVETISLFDLSEYVTDAVNRWAKNARDSRQQPELYSLNKEGVDAQDVELNFRQRSFLNLKVEEPQVPEIVANLASTERLDELWQFYNGFFNDPYVRQTQPQLLAAIENRLLRMEQIRYSRSPEEEVGAWDALTTQVDQLLNRVEAGALPNPDRDEITLISNEPFESLLQVLSPVNRPTEQQSPDASQVPDPKADEPETTELQNSKTEKPAESPDEKNKALRDKLTLLNQEQRVALIWGLLQKEDWEGDYKEKLTDSHLDDYVEFIRNGKNGPDTEYRLSLDDRFQFFLLLKNNTPIGTSTELQKAFRAAIQCRNASNRVINHPSMTAEISQVLFWNNLESRFEALEHQRRTAEDRLLAGEYVFANAELIKLVGHYERLRNTGNTLAEAWNSAREVLFVAPRLRALLVQEAIYHGQDNNNPLFADISFNAWMKAPVDENAKDMESEIEVEALAKNLAAQILDFECESKSSTGQTLDEINTQRTRLDTWLGQIKIRLQRNYQSTWSENEESAARNLLQGILFLQTSLPEYLKLKGLTSDREEIRKKLDAGIRNESEMMAENWPNLGNVDSSKPKFLQLNKNDDVWTAGCASWNDVMITVSNADESSRVTDRTFDSLDGVRGEIENLLLRDLDLQTPACGYVPVDGLGDIGIKTLHLAEVAVERSRLNRSWWDLWGNGTLSEKEAPTFVRLANASLNRLRNELIKPIYEIRHFPIYVDADLQKIMEEMDQTETAINTTWISLQGFEVAWRVSSAYPQGFDPSNDPDKQGFKETLGTLSPSLGARPVYRVNLNREVKKYPTEVAFQANLLGTLALTGPRTVVPELMTVRQQLGAEENLSLAQFLAITPQAIAFSDQGADSPKEKKTGVYVRQHAYGHVRFSMRGHWFAGTKIKIETKNPPEEIPVVAYELQIDPPRSESVFMIENSAQKRADVHFVLDCSKSMENAKIKANKQEDGLKLEAKTRFDLAKAAIKDTAQELQTDGRFRIGLSVFGHRATYKRNANDGPVDNDNDGYADTVPPAIHPAIDHEFIESCQINDNGKSFSKTKLLAFNNAIDELEALGRTPLYYSINECLDRLSKDHKGRTKHLVILTDGDDAPFPKGSKNISFAPNGEFVFQATELSELKQRLNRKEFQNIRLYIYKIVAPGETEESQNFSELRAWADGNIRIQVETITQNEIRSIPDTILNAIGRNSYSLIHEPNDPAAAVTVVDKKSMPTEMGNAKQGGIHENLKAGQYEVRTDSKYQSVSDSPGDLNKLEFDVEGGESISVINRNDGLFFTSKPLDFIEEPKLVIVNENWPFEVGLVDMTKSDALYFGFQPKADLLDIDRESYLWHRRYNYRPRRLWVRLIDKDTDRKIDLFAPVWEEGDQQIARFDIPKNNRGLPIIDVSNADLDVQLYFQPYDMNDSITPELTPESNRKILKPVDKSTSGQVGKLSYVIDPKQGRVEVNCEECQSGIFVGCEINGQLARCKSREIRLKQDKRVLEIWEFDIDEESNPKFFLFQEDPQAVQEDGGLLSDSIVTDPVFGAKTHALLFLIPPTN